MTIVRVSPLYEQAYVAIRNGILDGTYGPGDRLVETELAEALQISRTPVREALRRLEREGLVEADARGGVAVARLEPADIARLYECRLALETVAARHAAMRAGSAELEGMELALAQVERSLHGARPRVPDLLDENMSFHRQIIACAENPWLEHLWEQTCSRIGLFRAFVLGAGGNGEEIVREHRAIFERIKARDADGAASAMAYHLTADQRRGLERLRVMAEGGLASAPLSHGS
ncbi:MAG TPA: GntR family transcriptional regulator [Bacillota bacterium]